jgi:hypothetical protein
MPAASATDAAPEASEAERAELQSKFLDSEELVGLFGEDHERAEVVQRLSRSIMTFSFDYVRGTPLRLSPVLVEIFSLDWAPRKVVADREAIAMLPDVLAAWIRFAGRRRGIPEEAISESVEAAHDYAPEMIDLATDPANWGPGKTIALAIEQRGIDLNDETALEATRPLDGPGGLSSSYPRSSRFRGFPRHH